MRVKTLINEMLENFEDYKPSTLSQMACDVRASKLYTSISLMVRNSKGSNDYMRLQCYCLLKEKSSDIGLACLLVILSDLNDSKNNALMSSASKSSDEYYWSRAMASSSLFNEASNEKLRITS